MTRDLIFNEEEFLFAMLISHTEDSLNSIIPVSLDDTPEFELITLVRGNVDDSLALSGSLLRGSPIEPTKPLPQNLSSPEIIPQVLEPSSVAVGPALRCSMRERQTSILLAPYVTYSAQGLPDPSHSSLQSPHGLSGTLYLLANYILCTRFSDSYKEFLSKITVVRETRSLAEAMLYQEWCDAMGLEITTLEKNRTWDLTNLSFGKKAIDIKWIFMIKYNADGTIARYKAHLVALGNRQEEGLDYAETFALVSKMKTVQSFLKVYAARKWELHQMDIYNAFVHGKLTEEVYVRLSQDFSNSALNKVCKILKSLYGLKQAPQCWFSTFQAALLRYGFTQSCSNYSLFSFLNGPIKMYLTVNVDDLVIGGNDTKTITAFCKF